jgi:hypothetical protein
MNQTDFGNSGRCGEIESVVNPPIEEVLSDVVGFDEDFDGSDT